MSPAAKSTVCLSAGVICVLGATNAVFMERTFPLTTVEWLVGAVIAFAGMIYYEAKDVSEDELDKTKTRDEDSGEE